jgi:hypothetical protein
VDRIKIISYRYKTASEIVEILQNTMPGYTFKGVIPEEAKAQEYAKEITTLLEMGKLEISACSKAGPGISGLAVKYPWANEEQAIGLSNEAILALFKADYKQVTSVMDLAEKALFSSGDDVELHKNLRKYFTEIVSFVATIKKLLPEKNGNGK